MEFGALVALRPPLSILRLARAELAEILSGLGSDVGEQLHLDSTQRFSWAGDGVRFDSSSRDIAVGFAGCSRSRHRKSMTGEARSVRGNERPEACSLIEGNMRLSMLTS